MNLSLGRGTFWFNLPQNTEYLLNILLVSRIDFQSRGNGKNTFCWDPAYEREKTEDIKNHKCS